MVINYVHSRKHEIRCIERRVLAESLAKELPEGSIRFSSKLVSFEESCSPNDNYYKILHLGDGSFLKAKVLIGCDGTNSSVGRWLGLKAPWFIGRCAIRGFIYWISHHVMFLLNVYQSDAEFQHNPMKMKEFVLKKLGSGSDIMRLPWDILWGDIAKGNVFVT
ncbi:hypothetical protein V2J09_006481 [Rumex salicifolius]